MPVFNIVAESWLNDRATNENRGKLLSLYMVVTYIGVGAGQLLLNLAEPGGFPLFLLTSVLISVAVVPLFAIGRFTTRLSRIGQY